MFEKMLFLLMILVVQIILFLLTCTKKKKMIVEYNDQTGEIRCYQPKTGITKKVQQLKDRHAHTSESTQLSTNKSGQSKMSLYKIKATAKKKSKLQDRKNVQSSEESKLGQATPESKTDIRDTIKDTKINPTTPGQPDSVSEKADFAQPQSVKKSVKGGDINEIFNRLANDPAVKNVLEQPSEISDIPIQKQDSHSKHGFSNCNTKRSETKTPKLQSR